jgi:tetratricopeptide (TPR) repeat protein
VEKGLELAEEALAATRTKQPDWEDLPNAIKLRLSLLNGDLASAEKIGGSLEPVSIPYVHFTILVRLANVELAMATGDHERALTLVEELLGEVMNLTRPDVPEAIRIKGDILMALSRPDEAYQTLNQARAMAEEFGSKHELWPILASLARAESVLGRETDADRNREEARRIVQGIANTLSEPGLGESFLAAPGVRALMR